MQGKPVGHDRRTMLEEERVMVREIEGMPDSVGVSSDDNGLYVSLNEDTPVIQHGVGNVRYQVARLESLHGFGPHTMVPASPVSEEDEGGSLDEEGFSSEVDLRNPLEDEKGQLHGIRASTLGESDEERDEVVMAGQP